MDHVQHSIHLTDVLIRSHYNNLSWVASLNCWNQQDSPNSRKRPTEITALMASVWKWRAFLFFCFPFQSMSVTTQKMITVILQVVTLGSGVSALPSKTVGLYIGCCCCCLGAKPVWEAGTCCKTASRGTLRAKVVSFCPDSLAPVQAIGRLPI